MGGLGPSGSSWRAKKRKPNVPTVAPTGEKNVHTVFLRPKKRTSGEGRPSQAGWVQVGPWKAGGGYQRLTYGEPWGNVGVTLGLPTLTSLAISARFSMIFADS